MQQSLTVSTEKLAKELTSDEIAGFKELQKDKENNPDIKGVWFEESYIRKYPFSTLACDAIGFASAVNEVSSDWSFIIMMNYRELMEAHIAMLMKILM